MSKVLYTNNAESTLNAAVSVGATSFYVQSGTGGLFPAFGPDEIAYIRLGTDSQNEVVKVTARTGDLLTCEALACNWVNGSPVILTINAEALESFAQLDGHGQVIRGSELTDYSETVTSPASSSGALTLDLENSNVFAVTLTENTVITISNPPESGKAGFFTLIVTENSTGGFAVTWPASVTFGGYSNTLNTDADGVTIYGLITVDGGTTWHAMKGWA